jgi:hypothetical protein
MSPGSRPTGSGRLPRRRTDRVEDGAAWALTTVGLLVLFLSVLAGVWAGADAAERGRAANDERAQVEAVVLHDAPRHDQEFDSDAMGWTSVRYPDLSGGIHEADLPMATQSSAGSTVQVWVDRAGRLAPAPPEALAAMVVGAMVGLGMLGTGALLLVTTWIGLRHFLDVRNGETWGREWEKVEPVWSGRCH